MGSETTIARWGRTAWMGLGLALAPTAAEAAPTGADGLAALRLEFGRDGASASRAELDARYAAACEEGWSPACQPTAWRPSGRSQLTALGAAMAKACEAGDPLACTAVGWAQDAAARGAATPADATPLYRKAALLWKTACDSGGVQAACHEYAGQLYENRGIQADPAAGVQRWQKACDAGEGASCAALGLRYADGGAAVKVDAKKATALAQTGCGLHDQTACALVDRLVPPSDPAAALQARCDGGVTAACLTLAGDAPPAAGSSAEQALFRACDLGDGPACARAAEALRATDPARATERWTAGCTLGDPACCSALGDLLVKGAPPDAARESLFVLACEVGGHPDACATVAGARLSGLLPRDPARARAELTRACTETAGANACFTLGDAFAAGTVGERDRTQAATAYGKACAQGHLESCERRGTLLVGGVGVARDDAGAVASLQVACDGGRAAACWRAGVVLDEAIALPRDPTRALQLYDRGCELGKPEGCFGAGRLREMDPNPDYAGARGSYQRAVDGDVLPARAALARLLWGGLGGPSERAEAKQLAAEACQAGDRSACGGPMAIAPPGVPK
jgi:TPR repeat protein